MPEFVRDVQAQAGHDVHKKGRSESCSTDVAGYGHVRGEHERERRQESPGATAVESPKRDCSVFPPLREEERGDEETRQHEEEVNPKPASDEKPRMVCEHEQD